ncbi:DUF922 domain-containing protein [Winogradskyella aurantia]|uniref:DUF922 domain-containing protein n=1 Tax=Winogradskyella aurantia TaxID=1915063 RepID=A0A265UQE3_9FLAO|nr:DUF922 domain-containing protein [Winogradskyella aurantia]OZV67544.1 DUF922 domain-containing protein [Winogradskyella aurantia]
MFLKNFGALLLMQLVISQSNIEEVSMTWNASRPLTWTDFKAAPNFNTSAVALTATGITFGYSLATIDEKIVDFTTDVNAHFYPNQSWYLKQKADPYILKHEQLHFNITELYVRLFRKKLKGLKVNQNISHQLDNLHKSINRAADETQKRYDVETNHSINNEAQKAWEVAISEALKNLEEFSSK